MPEPRPIIVVGYDGSPSACAAVDAAIDRAGTTGTLIVVHAYDVPAEYIGAPYFQDMLDTKLQRANEVMDGIESACARLATVAWEPDVVAGPPGEVICCAARVRNADEIVIGTHGHGRIRAILGSVSLDVLHHATCPVLVIPERVVDARTPTGAGREVTA